MVLTKKANVTWKISLLVISLLLLFIVIAGSSDIIHEKYHGILEFFSFVKRGETYEVNAAANQVSDLYKNHSYSFLLLKANCNGDPSCKDISSRSYASFGHDLASSCQDDGKIPDYLSPEGCWIIAIEDDAGLYGADDCANVLSKIRRGIGGYQHGFDCVNKGSLKCSSKAFNLIEICTYNNPSTCNPITLGLPQHQWLCGKQKPGPKVWFLCDPELAQKQANTNLTLFQGLKEDPLYYNCSCSGNDNCEWKKLDT